MRGSRGRCGNAGCSPRTGIHATPDRTRLLGNHNPTTTSPEKQSKGQQEDRGEITYLSSELAEWVHRSQSSRSVLRRERPRPNPANWSTLGLVLDVDCDGGAGCAYSVEVAGHADQAVGAVGHCSGVPLGEPAVVGGRTGGDRLVAEI
jgi:hypothetical protein